MSSAKKVMYTQTMVRWEMTAKEFDALRRLVRHVAVGNIDATYHHVGVYQNDNPIIRGLDHNLPISSDYIKEQDE